jgi:hypothetical protein
MVEEILAAMVHPLVPVPDHTMPVSMPGVPELYEGWPEPLSPVDVQLKGCPPAAGNPTPELAAAPLPPLSGTPPSSRSPRLAVSVPEPLSTALAVVAVRGS